MKTVSYGSFSYWYHSKLMKFWNKVSNFALQHGPGWLFNYALLHNSIESVRTVELMKIYDPAEYMRRPNIQEAYTKLKAWLDKKEIKY